MDSKLLYAATVAVSLISTVAMADPAPLTRAQVNADVQPARADGTLQRTDYDRGSYRPEAIASKLTRAQAGAELAQATAARSSLPGPLADSRYNPYGAQVLQTSTLARNEVKNKVLAAAANGTLQRTDYDDAALMARQSQQQPASGNFAQRFKAKFGRDAS